MRSYQKIVFRTIILLSLTFYLLLFVYGIGIHQSSPDTIRFEFLIFLFLTCLIAIIWGFFDMPYEIISRTVAITSVSGFMVLLFEDAMTAPTSEILILIMPDVILLISLIYSINKSEYITLDNFQNTISKLDYKSILQLDYTLYFLLLLLLFSIITPFIIYGSPDYGEIENGEVTFNQASSQTNNTTDVMVTVDSMNESDYMIVKEYNEDHMVYAYWEDSRPNQVDYAPDFSSDAASASNYYKSATLISAGDNAIVQNLKRGDIVHVYAAADGREIQIEQYYVK